MEPSFQTKDKRQVAVFVPYRKNKDNVLEFFLQLRDEHAPVHANMYSLFGGGIDTGENLQTALKREVQEELEYVPKALEYFSDFETVRGCFHVFIEVVDDMFEKNVVVKEGKGGTF